MRRGYALIICLSVLFSVLTACNTAIKDGGEPYVTFNDDMGEEISLSHKPTKVAVLFSSFADIWTLAGGEIYITVGETVERGIVGSEVLLVDPGAGKTVNCELLISYAPDLVICSADIGAQSDAARLLRSVGIVAACFRVESFADYLRVLGVFTDITGNKDAYAKHGIEIDNEIKSLISSLSQNVDAPKILFIRAGSSARSTKAKNADQHFACAMLDELGAYNIADSAPILLDGLSIEEILRQDPDIIFITSMGDDAASRNYFTSLIEDPVWQTLGAIRNERYYFLEKELFQYKPNSRWLDAYKILSEILYENEKD